MQAMKRLEKIVNSPGYQQYYEATARWEKERIHCHHDYTHFRDTARVAMILYLSKEIHCPELTSFSSPEIREIIYTVGYLHDIGRFLEYADPKKDHAEESAKLSRPLLKEAGFSCEEQVLIEKAIRNHRKKDNQGFDALIWWADKISRPCFDCPAVKTCKKFSKGQVPALML